MLEGFASVNGWVGGIVWGPVGLALLLGAGFWMTARTHGFQFRYFGHWMGHTLGAIFSDRRVTAHTNAQDGAISQFQSLCTALAATIGTGNIVGVAAAILKGGPGAVFWMWAMALLGMMTSYAENVLGIYYRRKNAQGTWAGGAMYYLRDGLGGKKGCKPLGCILAALFSGFCVLASFGMGNMSQVNAIAGNLKAAFTVPPWASGAALTLVSAVVLMGGLKRVASVTEKLVPGMAALYIAGALLTVGVFWRNIPAAFAAIFRGAFGLEALEGGLLGCLIKAQTAMAWGMKRGAFSNEAGLGSSVMANASSNVKEPAQQGMWGIFEVFADTIVICTLTALVILTSGLIDLTTGAALCATDGSALVGAAFGEVFGAMGPKFVAVAVLLFAYSTVLGWSHYGTTACRYLLGEKAAAAYRGVFIALVFCGATMPLDLVWTFSDTCNGLMMLPNLIGILALSGTVGKITQNYLARLHGAAIAPMLSAFEEK
ncbi:MAG: alanine:cation symporter family protein [Faecalibacterium sp.]|jgi:AGCS family alanine or glycine:cation symporter|nr:alanine:cation symporter family protein [Faecalibacterium sp.]